MAAGDIKTAYGTSTDFTVTNLHALASDANLLAGWESNAVDNTSNLYRDYLISGAIKVHDDAALTASKGIYVYVVAMISDDTWPDVFDGTESLETVTNTAIRDKACKLGAFIQPATTQNLLYPFGPFSVANLFGGVCPPKFGIFIVQDTGQAFHTSGSIVTYQGIYDTVAQS